MAARANVGMLAFVLAAVLYPAAGLAQSSAAALNNEGSKLLQKGDHQGALARFQQAAKADPADSAIAFNVGLALFRVGHLREALEPLGRAVDDPASAANARFLRGVIYFQLGDYPRSLEALEPIRGDGAFGERVLYMLVESHRRSGSPQESHRAFAELNQRYPDSAFVHKLLAEAYDAAGEYDKAAAELEAALAVQPALPDAAFGLGLIRFKQGRTAEAVKRLRQELALDPCHERSLFYLGRSELEQQSFEKAEALFRKAVECGSPRADVFLAWGAAREEQDDLEGALVQYRKAAEAAPETADAHYRVARALRKLGREAESTAAFERVRAIREREREQAIENLEEARTSP